MKVNNDVCLVAPLLFSAFFFKACFEDLGGLDIGVSDVD